MINKDILAIRNIFKYIIHYITIMNYTYDQLLYDQLLYELPNIKHVISEEEFNKLEKKHYSIDEQSNNKQSNNKQSNNTCPITQIEFLKDEEIIELPCSHNFNPIAIKKWLMEEKGECPVCRYKFKTIVQEPEPVQAEQTQVQAEQTQVQAEQTQVQAEQTQIQAQQTQVQAQQIQAENLTYNPSEFNNFFNNFMETDVIYVYINNNIYIYS
jgi:hypothetical protein